MCASASRALSNPRLNSPAVQARVGVLIVHPGSRAQHLQNRYRRLNGGAQKCDSPAIALLCMFWWDFDATMATATEIAVLYREHFLERAPI